ncbi:MAG: DUF86 domain-containing protein [Bacteroidetes bacterium]|nr:DUF86 domain-containing protein [Bacteroidota bacterium]
MHPDRLAQLEENVAKLRAFKKEHSQNEVLENLTLGWALRYGLFESIQLTIDIACHIAASNNFGKTSTYKDCVNSLQSFNILDEGLAERLRAMVGLRNILIHEYVKIDVNQLYAYLNLLDDFSEFIAKVSPYAKD